MADSRFFERAGPFSLGEIAVRAGATLAPEADADTPLRDVAPLDRAGPGDLTFYDNPKYAEALRTTGASAIILAKRHVPKAPAGALLLIAERPYRAYALAAQAFYPQRAVTGGVHPRAIVDPAARLGAGVAVAAGAVVEAGAEIGEGTSIGPNSVIGPGVRIGRDCRIGPLVVLSHCELGDRVTLHPGVKIGQDGFGFAPDPAGHVKVPQLGRVLVGDGCDIGANSTIDRGAGPDTVIGPGCWIDNLVQIGHNVTLGRGCIVVAQAGVAGSSQLEDFVAIGAQGGIAGHLRIGVGAQVAAKSGVMTDIPAGETWCGAPAMPIKRFFREVATLKRLAQDKD
jgi:UDP-3-O-[3-hydroxymyristoyl] glucosamine N-acyltransferase